MKKIAIYSLAVAVGMFSISSCELFKLDNYDGPDGSLSGRIIDAETGELIQSDIIEGTTLKITEHGYDNVTPQYLRVKCDGTYANTMLFRGTYTLVPDVRNFLQIEEQDVTVGKDTKLDIEVVPYLRLKDVKITKEYNTVTATFKLEATTSDNVKSIGLFVSDQPIVGSPSRLCATEQNLNAPVDPNKEYSIKLNVRRNSAFLKENKEYYFRVGALSSIGGAKYNYAQAEIINIGEFVEEPEPDYIYFDHCESLNMWNGAQKLTLDTSDPREGNASIRTEFPGGVVIFQKVAKEAPVDASAVSIEKGILSLDVYISNVDAFDWAAGDANIEITSGGNCDQQERAWPFRKASMRLQNGWNHLDLKLKEGNVTGGAINMAALNYFRMYHTQAGGGVTFKVDCIRLYENDED